MTAIPTALRKAAVLLGSLDETAVTRVLASLSPEEADVLRRSIRHATSINPQERQEVLREFMDCEGNASDAWLPGIELDASLAERLSEPHAGATVQEFNSEEETPWEFLMQLNRVQLARRLERESPQVAAVVLSQLPPPRAADVMQSMPPATRQMLIQRLSRLEEQDPLVLDSIRNTLEQEFPMLAAPPPVQQPAGWQIAFAIVEASSPSLREELGPHLTSAHGIPRHASADLPVREATSSTQHADRWTPPWLRLFAEQNNPWHFAVRTE